MRCTIALCLFAILCSAGPLISRERSARVLAQFPQAAIPIKSWMQQQGWKTQRGNPKPSYR